MQITVSAPRSIRPLIAATMDEGLQRHRGHRLVMLEDGVQADDLKIRVAEEPFDTAHLWQAFGNAARAEQLEAVEIDHPSAQAFEGQWRPDVEPLADGEFRRGNSGFVRHC